MAEKLKSFEFKSRSNSTYDWDKFLDGSIYKLAQGKDFECDPKTINTMVRKQANARFKKAKVSVDAEAGTVIIQAVDMTPAEKKAYTEKIEAKKNGEAVEDDAE